MFRGFKIYLLLLLLLLQLPLARKNHLQSFPNKGGSPTDFSKGSQRDVGTILFWVWITCQKLNQLYGVVKPDVYFVQFLEKIIVILTIECVSKKQRSVKFGN